MRTLPIVFRQRDFSQPLGTSNVSIADAGCYLCSYAMLANYYGKQITPPQLNDFLIQHKLYIDQNLIDSDDTLQKVYPDILFQQDYYFPNEPPTPADLGLLKTLLADPTISVILCIDLGGGNTHFTVAVDTDGVSTVAHANPWTGRTEDFAGTYGDPKIKILKYVVYKGSLTEAINYEQLFNQCRNDRDQNWTGFNEVVSFMGVQVDPNDKPGTVQRAKDKINQYNSQISQLTQEVGDWKKKYETELGENHLLNGTLEALGKSNKDYTSQAADAQRELDDEKSCLYAIADKLGINREGIKDADLTEKCLIAIEGKDTIIQKSQKQQDKIRNEANKLIQVIIRIFGKGK